MTIRRIACVLATAAVVFAVGGCQSGSGTGKASAPPVTTTAADDTVPRPAPVTAVPTDVATTSAQLLSKTWGPRLDALAGSGPKACGSIHTQACAHAVAAAGEAARGFVSDTQSTGTTGRYVQAQQQADAMTGSAASYDSFACASTSPKAPDSYCVKYVQGTIAGVVVLKAQITADEHQAGLL